MKFNARTVYINDTQEADQLTRKQPDDYLKHYKRASLLRGRENLSRLPASTLCIYMYMYTASYFLSRDITYHRR